MLSHRPPTIESQVFRTVAAHLYHQNYTITSCV